MFEDSPVKKEKKLHRGGSNDLRTAADELHQLLLSSQNFNFQLHSPAPAHRSRSRRLTHHPSGKHSPYSSHYKSKSKSPPRETEYQEKHLESIENLYTLKKVQNKVKDRVVSWIDFTAINAEKERRTEKP